MPEQLIVEATPYTPLPKPHERRFEVAAYGWQSPKKREPLRVKEMLPQKDMEILREYWTDTDKMLENQRYEDQADFKNAERQMGKVMHSSDLIRRILKLNKNLIVEESKTMKGNAAFYWTDGKEKKYTNASFPLGWVSEFTIMHTDAADLPSYYPTYGWRTVLVRLLKFKAITWQQIVEVFGDVHYGDSRSKHWMLNVKHFKA